MMDLQSVSLTELAIGCALVCLALTAIGLAFGLAAERLAWRRGRKVFEVKLKRGQLARETLGTAIFHVVFVPLMAIALSTGAMRFSGGWLAEILGFFVPWYAFQLFYYPLHRSMHSKRLFWMHRWHHDSLVTTPMTGFSMHPVEALGWCVGIFLPAIALAQLDLLGAWGWGTFFAAFWVGNIAGHANAEIFPFQSTRASTMLWTNPISYHSLHHARFDGHYGFVAATMDKVFGTEWSDWLAVHRRVWTGKPMTSLREREGEPSKSSASEI